jgi:hypothetical protein
MRGDPNGVTVEFDLSEVELRLLAGLAAGATVTLDTPAGKGDRFLDFYRSGPAADYDSLFVPTTPAGPAPAPRLLRRRPVADGVRWALLARPDEYRLRDVE